MFVLVFICMYVYVIMVYFKTIQVGNLVKFDFFELKYQFFDYVKQDCQPLASSTDVVHIVIKVIII